jgi:hypothetical protein
MRKQTIKKLLATTEHMQRVLAFALEKSSERGEAARHRRIGQLHIVFSGAEQIMKLIARDISAQIEKSKSVGARKRTRTSTPLREPAPEAGASANSAIRA